ncbi:MAG: SusC/RagA family TonB-linked outer membrane protein [Chitinophagaceae bacterium]
MLRKILLKALFVCTMLFLFQSAYSQDKVVSGKVSDPKDGSPIAGVSVSAKGGNTGTQTGTDGTYKLSVPASVTTLVFSSVGFVSQEVLIDGRSSVNVSLAINNASLGEVVVVAYGTRRRGDLTGSVTSVSSKDFQKGNIGSSEQLLQGKVAGLQITSGGGSAGGGSRIRIRGGASLNASNDPLIVIDGVPVEGNGIAGSANLLNTINPDDIESISVLKDASATALYGSRASNGVLIITTKKGSPGKLRYNFNTQSSFSSIGETVDVMTGDQIRAVVTADALATGNNTYKNLLGKENTDWQDQIYRMAFGNNTNLSVSGGIKNMPFRASIGYYGQEGILKTNKFNRYTASLNVSPKLLNDHLVVNIAAKFSQTNNAFANEGAIGSAVSFDPTQPVLGSKYGGYYEWLQADGKPIDLATRNPLALLQLRDNTSRVRRFVGNVQLDYKLHFFPDLHILANLGMDYSWGRGNDNIDSMLATDYKTGGRKTFYKQGKENILADVSLFYAKEIKSIKSKIDVLATHSYQGLLTNVYNYASFSYRAIANSVKPTKRDTIEGSEPTFLTDKPEFRLESYLGRINYTFNNKYLLTASIRRDASSRFSQETRVGYFPAVAAAWKINEEEFLKNTRLFTDLKLRLGWGITGQQALKDVAGNDMFYPYLPRYSQSNNSAQYQFGNSFYSFLRPAAYDDQIKWETTTTSNIGLDFGILQNRISGSVDFYLKKTEDLLSVIPVAPGSNFDISLLTNVGNMENRGVEVVLNTTPVKNGKVTWDFGFNVTYNKSKITNLLKFPDKSFKGIPVSRISGGTGNNVGKFAVGYAPFSYFVYKQVYSAESGKPIEGLYEDINRDGKVDDADRYLYKKPAPDFLLGINTQLSVDKWTLSMAAHGAFGNYLYNNFNSNGGVLRAIKNPLTFIGNASSNYFESTQFVNNQYLSDYYIENASYVRLDNVNVGYNAGHALGKTTNMRVMASIQNVFVITKYKGLDPENSSDSGVDNNIYPRPRIFSLGVNVDF